MASTLPPVKGVAYNFPIALVDQGDTDVFQTTVTITTADVWVSIDGGAFAAAAAAPTELLTGGSAKTGVLWQNLTSTEMNGDLITVLYHDAAGDEWQDALVFIQTCGQTFDATDLVADGIKTKTDYLPSAAAGASNGLPILGSNSAGMTLGQVNIAANVAGEGALHIVNSDANGYGQYNEGGATGMVNLGGTTGMDNTGTAGYGMVNSGGTAAMSPLPASAGDAMALTATYDAAKTAAQAGDAMALTSGERTTLYAGIVAALTAATAYLAAIAAAVWAYATRTLTQSAATVTSVVSGSTITATRGDTLTASVTGLGNISTRSKLWFTVKDDNEDLDSAAMIQIEETGGLLYMNGAAAGTASNGSITVTNETTGALTIVLKAAETDDLRQCTAHYDIQMLTSAGVVTTLTQGVFDVGLDTTRAVS